MEAIKNTVNQATESLQGRGAEAEKEGNKAVAKDSNASLGDRAKAGADAVGNKADEAKHDTKSDAYKHS